MAQHVEEVPVRGTTIRLGQFLKLADLIDSGSDAKAVIAEGLVTVNDEVELRRGRQLAAGDAVSIGGRTARVVQA
jgi:ribosome-associated protein